MWGSKKLQENNKKNLKFVLYLLYCNCNIVQYVKMCIRSRLYVLSGIKRTFFFLTGFSNVKIKW